MSRHTPLDTPTPAPACRAHKSSARVLIATDDVLTLQALEVNVDRLGYEAVVVSDDRGILHSMEQYDRPPMIILDGTATRFDTAALCRRIRLCSGGASPSYILLITTGADGVRWSLDPPFAPDDFINSPFTSRELHARISVGMRIIDLQRDLAARAVDLDHAEKKIKKLSGLLPICYHCKKIRDDKGYWNEVDKYISDHSDAEFSHAICPTCLNRYYPDVKDEYP